MTYDRTAPRKRPEEKQVKFNTTISPEAAAIIAQMPKGEASRAISAAIIAAYSPDDHQKRMAVLSALLYDAELDTLIEPNDYRRVLELVLADIDDDPDKVRGITIKTIAEIRKVLE